MFTVIVLHWVVRRMTVLITMVSDPLQEPDKRRVVWYRVTWPVTCLNTVTCVNRLKTRKYLSSRTQCFKMFQTFWQTNQAKRYTGVTLLKESPYREVSHVYFLLSYATYLGRYINFEYRSVGTIWVRLGYMLLRSLRNFLKWVYEVSNVLVIHIHKSPEIIFIEPCNTPRSL